MWWQGQLLPAFGHCLQVKKRVTEAEMVGWCHRPNGHEFEQTPGDREGQGSLVCSSLWRRRVGHG